MTPITESRKVTRSPSKWNDVYQLVIKDIRGKISRSKSRESKADDSPDVSQIKPTFGLVFDAKYSVFTTRD
jgi:hypothetical protein